MRVLCDANIGSIIAQALAEDHDVVRAIHAVPHAPDEAVLAYAVREERVLVTCDSDFGELIFFKGHRAPPAVVYIRFEPEDVREIVQRLIPLMDFAALSGHMTVLDDLHVRRRPLPSESE